MPVKIRRFIKRSVYAVTFWFLVNIVFRIIHAFLTVYTGSFFFFFSINFIYTLQYGMKEGLPRDSIVSYFKYMGIEDYIEIWFFMFEFIWRMIIGAL